MHLRRRTTAGTAGPDSRELGVVVKDEVQGGRLGFPSAAQAGEGEGRGLHAPLSGAAEAAGCLLVQHAARAVEDGDVGGRVAADERGLEKEREREGRWRESDEKGLRRGSAHALSDALRLFSVSSSSFFYLGHVQAAALGRRNKGHALLAAWEMCGERERAREGACQRGQR